MQNMWVMWTVETPLLAMCLPSQLCVHLHKSSSLLDLRPTEECCIVYYRGMQLMHAKRLYGFHICWKDLGITKLPVLHCDSQSAIMLAWDPIFHAHTSEVSLHQRSN